MITELRLQNFRGFEDHVIPFHKTTIVVGKNNAGKSTIVEALRLLALITARYKGLNFTDVPRWLDIPRRSRGVAPSLEAMEINLTSVFHRYGEPPAIITGTFEAGERITIYIGREARIHAVITDRRGNLVASRGEAQRIKLPQVNILPQIAPLPDEESLLTPEYVVRSMATSRSSLHFRNQLQFVPDSFPEFKRISQETWPGLRIDSFERGGYGATANGPSLLIQDNDFVAEVGWMGHGLQMWLQTMWFLAYSQSAETVILDEPDVYMHADLQRRLIRLLKGGTRQVIVATHSTEIMAEVEPDDILVVDRRRRKSIFAPTLPAVQQVLRQFGSVHNIQLARLWSARLFLLVEGKDVSLLKRFQNILFPQSNSPLDTIPSMAIGGWSGWKYVIGSSMFLKNAGGEHIKSYCVLDSDYHTPEQIGERYTEAVGHNIQLRVWDRKEIENYLLVPSAIHRLISEAMEADEDPPTLGEVEHCLEHFVDELKDEVMDALSTEMWLQNKAGGVAAANRFARDVMAKAWASADGRLAIVPGKRIISMLSGWSQATYGPSFNALRIASTLQPNEVHPEVKTVISAIEDRSDFDIPSSV